MSLSRLIVVALLCGCVEFAVFEWRFHDLVHLTRPVVVLAQEPGERFAPLAARALSRPTLARAKLETIAQAATARSDRELAIRALARLAREYPSDTGVWIRLANALREAGRIEEAEQVYRRAIRMTPNERQ